MPDILPFKDRRASTDKFRILFERAADAHFIFSKKGGILDCNEATVKLLRCRAKEEVLSLHPAVLSPEFQPDGRRSIEKSVEMDRIAWTQGHHSFEWVHRKMDGEEFPVQVLVTAAEIDGEDVLIAAWHDLTEIKEAEQKLKDLNRRMTSELRAAAEFQQSLLPTATPYSDKFKSSWYYKPCEELGGDSLNIFRIDDTHVGLYVLDVTGHGVASALLSVTVTHFLSGLFRMGCPQKVTEGLNKHFSNENYVNHSFTLVYGVMDLEKRVFDYTSAGHVGPIKVTCDGKVEQFDSHGPPVGMLEDAVYGRSRISFSSCESLFLLSDGVYEARNPAGIEMGLPAVYDHLARHFKCHSPLEAVVNSLAAEAHAWSTPQKSADDISIVGFQVR